MVSTPIIRLVGWLLVGFGALQGLPMAVALDGDETVALGAFALSAGIALFLGGALVIVGRGGGRVGAIGRREGLALAVLGWMALGVFGALPLVNGGIVDGYAAGVFEALSGLTTTGLTVIADAGLVERSVVLWRAMLQWLGGLATLLFAVALVPSATMPTGIVAAARARRGQEPFRPHFAQALKIVGTSYLVLSGLCLVALVASGLPPFNALCYAMATVSTGGFVPDTGGPAALGNAAAEWVLMVFMIAGSINFLTHWAALGGRPQVYRYDPEIGFLLLLVTAAAVLVWLVPLADADGIRRALFSVVSAASTTGFPGAEPAPPVPVFPLLVLAGLALVGGASVSTAGGIKLARALLLLRHGGRELQRLSHPHGVVLVKIGRASVSDSVMQGIWSLFVLFVFCLIILTIGLSAGGLELAQALVLALSALTNTGPLLDQAAGLGVGLGGLDPGILWLLAAGMLVGRLEVFAVLMLLTPVFWQRRSREQP